MSTRLVLSLIMSRYLARARVHQSGRGRRTVRRVYARRPRVSPNPFCSAAAAAERTFWLAVFPCRRFSLAALVGVCERDRRDPLREGPPAPNSDAPAAASMPAVNVREPRPLATSDGRPTSASTNPVDGSRVTHRDVHAGPRSAPPVLVPDVALHDLRHDVAAHGRVPREISPEVPRRVRAPAPVLARAPCTR